MPTPYEAAQGFRKRLARNEAEAERRLLAAYADAYADLNKRLAALLAEIGTVRPTQGQLARLYRYQDLLDALDAHIASLSGRVATDIERQQAEAVRLASRSARAQIDALIPPDSFIRVQVPPPDDALRALVGIAGDGSTLAEHLDAYGRATRQAVRDELLKGIVAGSDIRRISQAVRNAWGQGLTRALALSRTETLRAYREGTRASFLANSRLVGEWEWLATRSKRTCAACLALDGRRFPLSEPMASHVNCRCAMLPVLRDDDRPLRRQTGPEWFAKQDEATQRAILGNKGYDAYRDGADLGDFVHWRKDRKWGKQATVRAPKQ